MLGKLHSDEVKKCNFKKAVKGKISLLTGVMLTAVVTMCGATIAQGANELYVETPTPAQIRQFYNENNMETAINTNITYSKNPVLSGSYDPGKLSTTTLNNALKTLNYMRYIAGIPANVTLDSQYTTMCQTGSMLNCLNGKLSHTPNNPSGVSEQMYELGYTGMSSSNIACGYSTFGRAIIDGWMNDSDAYNIQVVGHRRWILNPYMAKTGFGAVGSYVYSSMYAFDFGNESGSKYSNVAWPAAYTPTSVFEANEVWSVSTGEYEDISKIKVTVTQVDNGKKWSFSQSKSDGYFNVDNQGYGQSGCIIFRPSDGVDVSAGKKYKVVISGLAKGTLTYQVCFFNINASINNATVNLTTTKVAYDGTAKKPTFTVTLNGTKLKAGVDYTYSYSNNVNAGKATLTIKGKNCYTGSIVKSFAIVPGKVSISQGTNVSGAIKLVWGKAAGATGYQILRKEKGSTADYTVIGTVTTTYYSDKSVVSGKDYLYVVRGKCSAGVGANSNSFSIRCVGVGKITSASNIAAGVKLNWSKVSGVTGYIVYRKETGSSSSYIKIATVKGSTSVTYTDTAVKNNNLKKYTYVVKPYYSVQTVVSGTTKTVTTYGAFVASNTVRLVNPTLKSATKTATGTINVKWNRIGGVSGYVIVYKINGKSTSVKISAGSLSTTATTLNKVINNLGTGTYTVNVRSYKTIDGVTYYSGNSNTITVSM